MLHTLCLFLITYYDFKKIKLEVLLKIKVQFDMNDKLIIHF